MFGHVALGVVASVFATVVSVMIVMMTVDAERVAYCLGAYTGVVWYSNSAAT